MLINPVTITVSEHHLRIALTAMNQRLIAIQSRKDKHAASEREAIEFAHDRLTTALETAMRERANNA